MKIAMKRRGLRLLLLTLLLPCTLCVNAQLSYTFAQLSNGYTYNAGTSIIPGNSNDVMSAAQNIGFTFTYNCNTYTQFMVSSNGWMTLGTGMTAALSANNLGTSSQGPILAPLWDDMKIQSAGNVNMKLTGSAPNRIMTIEWFKVLWNSSASTPVMSYQVKLYETTNIVDFVYFRETGTINSGSASIGISSGNSGIDFYSVDATPAANYATDPQNLATRPTGNRSYRWTPQTMSYNSTTTTQNTTTTVSKCNPADQVILGVEVNTTGTCSPYSVTQFQMNMTGTTPARILTDVSKIHIYYTGNSSGFAPINEFLSGGTNPAAGNFTINGSQTLMGGTNYFWIAYDVAAGATVGDVLDAQCLSVNFTTLGAKTPTVTNPAGTRGIVNCSVAPGGINGMSFWVKSTAGTSTTTNAGTISTWSDQSGNGRDATQATSSHRPTYYDNSTNNMNFNPVVDFDDASQSSTNGDYMDILANGMLSPGNNPYTVYSVIKPGGNNTSTPGKYIFTGQAGANDFNSFDIRGGFAYNDSWNLNDLIVGNLWATGYPSLASFNYNTVQREMFIGGGSVGVKVGNDRISPDANNALGCQRSNSPLIEFFDGSIAEIVTYANFSHTTTQRYQVESYLSLKYGITLQHDYLSSGSTTIWDVSQNPAYNTNIIGVARDDNSSLSQKESKSSSVTPDILTLYIGPSKTTNQANNTGTFTSGDKSFFIAANNNTPYMYGWPAGPTQMPAGICCRLERQWMAQVTNFTNTDLKLEFDFNVITPGYAPLNTADLRLLVDNDGDFTNATILNSPAITISVAASVVTITVPASNFTSTPYFTLASVSTTTLLPVTISGFKGACRNNAVQLDWTKESGSDNSFTIERSSDGSNFTAIGTLQSNTPGPQAYTWSDFAPLAGATYYRLNIRTQDGVVTYSPVVNVNGCSHDNLQLATDPTTGRSSLLLQLQQNAQVDISLCDMLGQQMSVNALTGHHSFQPGYYQLPVNDRGLSKGIYVLTVSVNGNRNVFRVIQP
ncbi:MAG TPA: BNR-repeat neuraminidase N-terminal domain-containing protein [Chitinophagaceae bacterium]|jgi:hypothetical protein